MNRRGQGRLLLVLATLLGACAKQEPAPAPAPAPASTVATPASSPAAITHRGRGLRGKAIVGKDGYGIVPCGEQTQRIMEVDPSAQAFLDAYLEGGAHEFFVEAEGVDAEGDHVRVTRFHRLYSEGPGCEAQLDPSAFVAWGNEPFWAASDAGGKLRLERPGAQPLVATQSEARAVDGEWLVEGNTASGMLSLRLVPGLCRDGMSDALYAWSAIARNGETELKGCGFPGFERVSVGGAN